MVLRTTLRRVLALLGIVAVVLTPSTSRQGLPSDPSSEETAFARTLAPGDHAAMVPRPDRTVPDRSPLGHAAVVGAIAALLAFVYLRRRDRLEPPPAWPGGVLLRAPTRSPPLALRSA